MAHCLYAAVGRRGEQSISRRQLLDLTVMGLINDGRFAAAGKNRVFAMKRKLEEAALHKEFRVVVRVCHRLAEFTFSHGLVKQLIGRAQSAVLHESQQLMAAAKGQHREAPRMGDLVPEQEKTLY